MEPYYLERRSALCSRLVCEFTAPIAAHRAAAIPAPSLPPRAAAPRRCSPRLPFVFAFCLSALPLRRRSTSRLLCRSAASTAAAAAAAASTLTLLSPPLRSPTALTLLLPRLRARKRRLTIWHRVMGRDMQRAAALDCCWHALLAGPLVAGSVPDNGL